jgi:hypothetical protein
MIDVMSLHESLQSAGLPVVGVAYYPDPELRHTHVPVGPTWWYVAEDYAVRVDLSAPMAVDEETASGEVIADWRRAAE